MAIVSLDNYLASPKQLVPLLKTGGRTTVALQWFTTLDVAGDPGAGSLTIGNTTTGVVPVAGNTGFPALNAFGASSQGFLSRVAYGNTVAGRLALLDRLYHVGSVSLLALATTTLASQPSYASRVSLNAGAADYKNLDLWLEVNAAVSATATTVQVQYTNDAGVTGRLTNALNLSGHTAGRCTQLALQAGDVGVQRIDAVIVGGVVATTGTVNVVVARRLWSNRARVAGDGAIDDMLRTGLTELFATSALWLLVAADSTALGLPDLEVEVVNG